MFFGCLKNFSLWKIRDLPRPIEIHTSRTRNSSTLHGHGTCGDVARPESLIINVFQFFRWQKCGIRFQTFEVGKCLTLEGTLFPCKIRSYFDNRFDLPVEAILIVVNLRQ